METKVCTRCGRELPLDSFPKNAKAKDGHLRVCKDCNSKARSAARPGKKTAHYEESAVWAATPDAQKPKEPDTNYFEKAYNESGERLRLKTFPDKMLVTELRSRGWEVTCKRTITEEL